MNRIDVVLAVVLALFALRGLWRGFARELFALIGLVGGVAAAATTHADAALMLPPSVPDFTRPWVAFAAVFLAVFVAAKLVGALVHHALGAVALSPLDRIAGALFGAAKGAALIALGVLVVRTLTPPNALERACADSVLMQPLLELTDDGSAANAVERHLPEPVIAPPSPGGGLSMRGRIPEPILVDLRDRANIVEVVGAHVGLKRVGRNHVGLCPFHAEKSPSFTVNDEKGIFHCFGCGAGGNVFTFLMKMENLPFPDVVERLARRYGVTLPERGDDDPAIRRREALYRLNEKSARFFQRYLWDAAEAEAARAYLQERGIGRETADRFVLGYAPAGGEVLVRRMRDAGPIGDPVLGAAGHALALAQQLGLIGERRGGGGHYDRFRARLMFPITDSAGRVVGFGSRSVPGTPSANAELPKYLNSPETPLYKKGAHLYGLAAAREAIRQSGRAIVVEGYFDVLALAEAGVSHVVASLGTALTLEQLHLLRRFTRDIVAFFDGDAAGQRAAEKSLTTFIEAGLWGHGAFLPGGDDPDTFVRREGREALTRLLDASIPLLDFYLDRAVRPESSAAERAAAAKQVAQLLVKIRDPLEYETAIRAAVNRLGMYGIGEVMLRNATLPAAPAYSPSGRTTATPAGRPTSKSRGLDTPGAEELLVTLMLHDPALVLRVDADGALDLFDEGSWRSLAVDLVDTLRRGAPLDPATLLGRLDDADAARVAGRLLTLGADDAMREQILVDCLAKLRHRARERERLRVLRQIREDEAHGNDAAVAEGQRQLQELRLQELRQLD